MFRRKIPKPADDVTHTAGLVTVIGTPGPVRVHSHFICPSGTP